MSKSPAPELKYPMARLRRVGSQAEWHPIEGSFSIGRRRKNNNLALKSSTFPKLVSREHAIITWNPDEKAHILQDLKSTNGVLVNEIKVDRFRLRHGDKISFSRSHGLSIGGTLKDPKVEFEFIFDTSHYGPGTNLKHGKGSSTTSDETDDDCEDTIKLSTMIEVTAISKENKSIIDDADMKEVDEEQEHVAVNKEQEGGGEAEVEEKKLAEEKPAEEEEKEEEEEEEEATQPVEEDTVGNNTMEVETASSPANGDKTKRDDAPEETHDEVNEEANPKRRRVETTNSENTSNYVEGAKPEPATGSFLWNMLPTSIKSFWG